MSSTNGSSNGTAAFSALNIPGGPLDLSPWRFRPEDRAAVAHFAILLCECAGSVRHAGVGYELVPNRSGWTTLRSAPPALLERAAARTARAHPPWELPGEPAVPIHTRIGAFFESARHRAEVVR